MLLYIQLTKEIKRVGVKQIDGTVCTTFRKLHRETEGIFPDFMSTLMAAKRYQVRPIHCITDVTTDTVHHCLF